MKLVIRVFTIFIAIILTVYFFWYVIDTSHSQDFSGLTKNSVIISIIAAAFLYAMIIPISGFAWAQLLKNFENNIPTHLLSSIMAVTQIAKYVPGNVAQHISRASLSVNQGMIINTFLLSILMETILAVVASLLVGVVLLSTTPVIFEKLISTYQEPLTITLVSSISIGATAILLYKAVSSKKSLKMTTNHLTWSRNSTLYLLTATLCYCINYLIIGFGMWLIAHSMEITTNLNYALLTAAFSLAWLLGFLTPGAPAGFGVREAVLILLLSNSTQETQVLALILAMRVVTLLGDGLCFAVGTICLLRKANENCI